MLARLTTALGVGGSALPFDLGEAHPGPGWGPHWAHFRGTWRADGSPVSVFRCSSHAPGDARLEAARAGARRLRALRHPGVLAFRETVEVEERGETVVYLVTEAAAPLGAALREAGLDAPGPDRDAYLAAGLSQVVAAAAFLANDCRLAHGGLRAAAVLVTDALDWKLHGFDLATEAGFSPSMGPPPLAAAGWAVPPQYLPAEVARADWAAVAEGPAWAVDAWGLGCLIAEVYSGAPLARTEDLRAAAGAVPKPLLPHYQRLLASAPGRRLNPAAVAESGALRNKLGEVFAFLDALAVKDAAEKDAFFKRLPAALPALPAAVQRRKLLPALARALEFGGAPPSALAALLTVGQGLPEDERAARVVPVVARLFASTDRGIRRALLEQLPAYGAALPPGVVDGQIFPHVAAGFADANPYLRELTLKSMAVLGPKLGQKNLTQVLLKALAKLQVDDEASIRANATVLLGALAPHLGEATAKKVLLNAFGRAMRDPFPPARAAAARAVVATAAFHAPDDVAGRVVPALGPLCADGVGEVRAAALAALDHFAGVLRARHEELEARAAAAAAADPAGAAAAAAAAGGGFAPAPGGGGGGGGGGLMGSLGWAVSSLVSRGGDGAPPPPPPARGPSPAPAAAAPPAPPLGRGHGSTSSLGAAFGGGDAATPGGGGGRFAAPAEAAGGGWDADDDDFESMEDSAAAAAEAEARARLSRATLGGGRGGAARPARPPPAASRARQASWGSDAADGWDAPPPGALPAGGGGAPAPAAHVAPPTGGKKGGGMRLGGKKVGAVKLEDDFFADDKW